MTAAHDQLMKYHANASIDLPPGTATKYPTQAIVALWDPAITWIGGGWSAFKVRIGEAHCTAIVLVFDLTASLCVHIVYCLALVKF